jgi:NAD+ kinase
MKTGDVITINKAPFQLILMHPKDLSFFGTLRQKLLWGKDKRN